MGLSLNILRPKISKSHLPFLFDKSPDSILFGSNSIAGKNPRYHSFEGIRGLNTRRTNRKKRTLAKLWRRSMANKVDVNAKWDACLDLTVRRFVYSSLAGAFGGLLLFRTPVTRWASVAFGAGVGIGSAYTECSRIFDESPATLAHLKPSTAPAHDEGGQE